MWRMLALLFTSILQQISHTLKIEFTQTNINAKIMMTVLDSTGGFSHTVGDLQFSENATSTPPPSYQKKKEKGSYWCQKLLQCLFASSFGTLVFTQSVTLKICTTSISSSRLTISKTSAKFNFKFEDKICIGTNNHRPNLS